MKLDNRKRLAAEVLKCSPKKIVLDKARLDEIQEAITKIDIKGLIAEGAINLRPKNQQSRSGARRRKTQKRKNQQKGPGKKKGKKYSRVTKKDVWINRIRSQRKLLAELKEKESIEVKTYRELYLKAKGGFFRNKRHIKLYIEERGLLKK
ncbi:50S ribosomal protein L19e [Nanoarchaeota archaeon]